MIHLTITVVQSIELMYYDIIFYTHRIKQISDIITRFSSKYKNHYHDTGLIPLNALCML